MTEIHIDLNKLWAVSLCAPKNDIRYYLNGVYVEATASATRLCATNGHIMALHPKALPADFTNKGCEWETLIIPNEVIAKCKPQKNVSAIATVLVKQVFDPEGKEYSLRLWDGTLIPFTPVVGQFPDFRRVIPGLHPQGIGANFNVDYLVTFTKVAKALGDRDARIQMLFNDQGAIRIACADKDFVGVLMPQKPMERTAVNFDQAAWPAKGADPMVEDVKTVNGQDV